MLVTFAGLADSSAAGPVRPAALMRPMMEDLRSLVSLSLAPADIPQRRRDVTSALDRLMGQGGRIRAHFEAKQPT
ncbi:MAG: hypothetical protein K0U93_15420, partial [Gammaproteobacteria bacterium]|nr:hypothetical protein [Gammaproteobacteria bacterium]